MFKGFNRSVRGASHEDSGLVCQDSSAFFAGEYYAAAVVADGHGSKKHFRSDVGSRCAVEATLDVIEKFYKDPEEFERTFPGNHKMIIKNIEKQIISEWNDKVRKHLEENPVTYDEKEPFEKQEFADIPHESYYGTTLIAVVAGRKFSFGMQIGDGSLVTIFEDGEAVMPIEYNEAAPANITSSMCNANASKMFNSFYNDTKKLIAAFTSTDGLYTSFGSEYDFLDYHTIIASQISAVPRIADVVNKNLVKRSHYGTKDDVSFSCVYDDEYIAEKTDFLKEKVAENKQKAADRKARLLGKK